MEWNTLERAIKTETDTIKRSGHAWLVYVKDIKDINRNIPSTWRWARGDHWYDTGVIYLWYRNVVFMIQRRPLAMNTLCLWYKDVVFLIKESCVSDTGKMCHDKEVWLFMILMLCFIIRVRRVYDTGTLCLWYRNDAFMIRRYGCLW